MEKERFLTILIPITDGDCEATVYASVAALVAAVPVDLENVDKIYILQDGTYQRLWRNPSTDEYEYHAVVDREFPYLGKPLEIFDFTYDAVRMGQAPTISAQGVMWFADKDSDGNDVTLEGMWTQECHVSFNGENYYLKQIPTSSKSNEDARYRYDIDFVSERVILERVYLYDVVQPFVTEKPISESSQFSFYGNVEELAKRINASLIRSGLSTLTRKYVAYPNTTGTTVPYLTYEQWNQVMVDPVPLVGTVFANVGELNVFRASVYTALGGNYNRYLMGYIYENEDGVYTLTGYQCKIGMNKIGKLTTSEEKLITFDNNTIHEALQQVHDTFELQYYITKEKDTQGDFTGNTAIWIADCEHDFADWDPTALDGEGDYVRDDDLVPTTESPFDYGSENELLSKEKANTTDKIVTRITGVGSTENIPWYYPNPNPDGWIRPVYLRDGTEVQDKLIDYPTSEGSTINESSWYERFLKNRIGNTMRWGMLENIVTSMQKPGYNSTDKVYSTYFYIDRPSSSSPKLTLDFDFLKHGASHMTRFTAFLFRDIPNYQNIPYAQYDSSATYQSPTDFQRACALHDGSVPVALPYSCSYRLVINIYVSSRPERQRYDYEGYKYNGTQVTGAAAHDEYIEGVHHHYNAQPPAYIGEDFYQLDDLVPYAEWNELTFLMTGDEGVLHTFTLSSAGRSIDGTSATHQAPVPRILGKSYKNWNATGVHVAGTLVLECTDQTPCDINTGLHQTAYTPSFMNADEWFNKFMVFTARVYDATCWCIGNKSVSLYDYGMNNEEDDVYEPLSAEPFDWSTNYTSYYKLQGGNYVPVTGSSAPTFSAGTYYKMFPSLNYHDGSILPQLFDEIAFQRVKWVTPQQNLMPEVYIKTDGERRFYQAHNYYDSEEESLLDGTADTMVGEVQVGNKVRNPIYKENESDGDDEHYQFENEYIQRLPHEHIEDFDDVKPTIKEQRNYVAVSITQAQFDAQKKFFYTKDQDGEYIQCTNASVYSASTDYYALLRIDIVETFGYDTYDSDEIWESNDGGSIRGEYKHPYFFAKLRPLGFNIFDLALQDDMVLSMTTGNCGACNFKIGVDENTGKNPVQVWEYDVYGGPTYANRGDKLYSKGDLRRYVDTTSLYYNTNDTEDGYFNVERGVDIISGGRPLTMASSVPMFESYVYTAEYIESGFVGVMKQEGKLHFEGDVMTSGRFLDNQQDTSEDYVWVALMKDTDTYGVIMPAARPYYNDHQLDVYIRPKSMTDVHTDSSTISVDEANADKFVLTNIRMPQVYLRRAERDLSRKLVAYMYDNNYQKFNFSIKFSRIYLAQNADTDENLNENSVLYVSFNNRTYRQYVKHYTYRMSHDEVLPEISVDVNEELNVTRTSIQQQAAIGKRNNKTAIAHASAVIHQAVTSIERRTVSKNGNTIVGGNIIGLGSGTSLVEMAKSSQSQAESISSIGVRMETDYYKRDDFKVENGSDLNIGDEVFLPTMHKSGGVLSRRRWDSSQGRFVADTSEVFAPAFLDDTDKRLVDYHGEYQLLTSQPDDWATNFADYFKVVGGEYVALEQAETFAQNTYYTFAESVEQNSITPARVSGAQINYGASGVVKPLYMSSNVISERDYELLASQPSDWGSAGRETYYKKNANGDFEPITGSPAFAVNTYYKEVATAYSVALTEEYSNIVGAIDQIDVALRCASVTITQNQGGGYDGTFIYQIHPVRQAIDTEPDTCPAETSDFWFRTSTQS